MDIRTFTLILEPDNPVWFSTDLLRAYLMDVLARYTTLHKGSTTHFFHRYPAVQCKMIKTTVIVVGIGQGADVLEEISRGQKKILPGENACSIARRDLRITTEQFGISDTIATYEFLTPWLALNQQNLKKFYELNGKSKRDAFMQKILCGSLGTLAKSLDYTVPVPISCEAKLKFRKEWIGNKSVLVFLGKFQTNLRIPDYLGLGQSVSQGFGTVRNIPERSVYTGDEIP